MSNCVISASVRALQTENSVVLCTESHLSGAHEVKYLPVADRLNHSPHMVCSKSWITLLTQTEFSMTQFRKQHEHNREHYHHINTVRGQFMGP